MCGLCKDVIKALVLQRTGMNATSMLPVTIVRPIGSNTYNTNIIDHKENELYIGNLSIQKSSNEFSGHAQIDLTFFDSIIPYVVNPSHHRLHLDNQIISAVSIGSADGANALNSLVCALFTFQGYRITL